jgi:hypothetical protein
MSFADVIELLTGNEIFTANSLGRTIYDFPGKP